MRLQTLWAALVLVTVVATPAHADKVICDGNPLCIVALVPIVAVGAAVVALTPDPPEKSAAKAIQTGNLAQLQFVLQTHPQLLKDADKAHGLLLAAAEAGNIEATTLLLDAGVSANTGNSRALWYASTVAEIELLLARGANADEMNLGSLMHRLGSPVAVDLVSTLLNHRTALNPDDTGALTLLNSAVHAKKFAVVSLLLARGVNPDGPSDRPTLVELAYACPESDQACMASFQTTARELIAKGANVNAMGKWNCKTPLDAARQVHNGVLTDLLESRGATTPLAAQDACRARHKTASQAPQRMVDP